MRDRIYVWQLENMRRTGFVIVNADRTVYRGSASTDDPLDPPGAPKHPDSRKKAAELLRLVHKYGYEIRRIYL